MIKRLAERCSCWFFTRRELHRVVLKARDGQRAAEAVAAAVLADNVDLQRQLQETERFLEQIR